MSYERHYSLSLNSFSCTGHAIKHPNILELYGVCPNARISRSNKRYCFITPLCKGIYFSIPDRATSSTHLHRDLRYLGDLVEIVKRERELIKFSDKIRLARGKLRSFCSRKLDSNAHWFCSEIVAGMKYLHGKRGILVELRCLWFINFCGSSSLSTFVGARPVILHHDFKGSVILL